MSRLTRAPHRDGFTAIELMVVVAVTAILFAVAAPSFTGFLAKKRVEGVTSELGTDLQYARTEAVTRNAPVRLTLGAGCYVVHTHPPGAAASSCSQTAASSIGANAAEIKTVQIVPGSNANLSPASGYIEFDPVRGDVSATQNVGTPATLTVASTAGGWQMGICVNAMGRPATFSPAGAGHVTGYPTACP